jgi:hypothetical protein
MLNAISIPSHAKIRDSISGTERKVEVQPYTNYNVAVIDKSLKNNSYFSLINTNVTLFNDPFRANVTATDFQIRNKKKTFAIKGKGGISTRNEHGKETGFFAGLGVEKNSGKLLFGISELIHSDKYNPNDLGYLQRNNDMITESYINYNIIEPFSIFREIHMNMYWDHVRMYKNQALYGNEIGFNYYNLFRNNWGAELNLEFSGNEHDYYEPRVPGRYYLAPYRYSVNAWFTTDRRKAINLNMNLGRAQVPTTDEYNNNGNVNLNVRAGKRCQLYYGFMFENDINDRGYVDKTESEDTIYFARRNVNTIENSIEASYSFTNNASLGLRIRHYWSGADNNEYYQLNDDGALEPDPDYLINKDENYNAFTVDMIFRWIFAPGSEFTFSWKNSIFTSGENVNPDYFDNLSRTWHSDQINSLSVKILYYIDYNSLRKRNI